jgi:hypothetical protein
MNKLYKLLSAAVLSLCVLAVAGFGQQETPEQIVDRASQAYNHKWEGNTIKDYVGSGSATLTGNPDGPLDFYLAANKDRRVKFTVTAQSGSKLISLGTDQTKSWYVSGLFSGEAVGNAAHFIDNHTDRSIAQLFDKHNTLVDLGPADPQHAPESATSRVIKSTSKKGVTANYYIDNTTSLITRIEFETGNTYTMLFSSQQRPALAAFVFSNYQTVDGVPTPFKISIYEGLTKIEELNFTSMQYNTGIKNKEFVP